MKYRRSLLAMVLIVFTLTSCAMFQVAKEQPFSTWSSKKKLTYAVDVYSAEYDKYMAAVVRPDLSDGQRQYLKTKREALVGLDKAINLLIPIVDAGGQLTPDLELQLVSWLTQLGYAPM